MTDTSKDSEPPVSAPDYDDRCAASVSTAGHRRARAVRFVTEVLGATSTYDNDSFAALRLNGGEFMFHADHTYRGNPLLGVVAGVEGRGAGVELRVYGCDPDVAEARRARWAIPCSPAASTSRTACANA